MGDISLSVDAVVVGFENQALDILLIQRKNEPFKNQWALPGGFVEVEETLEDAAKRELEEETGVQASHMYQVHAFGNPNRDPRKRVVSVAYVTLLKKNLHQPKANDDAADAQWFSIKALPPLAFDHAEIIQKSIEKLRYLLDATSMNIEAEFSTDEWREIKRLLS